MSHTTCMHCSARIFTENASCCIHGIPHALTPPVKPVYTSVFCLRLYLGCVSFSLSVTSTTLREESTPRCCIVYGHTAPIALTISLTKCNEFTDKIHWVHWQSSMSSLTKLNESTDKTQWVHWHNSMSSLIKTDCPCDDTDWHNFCTVSQYITHLSFESCTSLLTWFFKR